MTKARGVNLDGYALTAVVTTPDTTFIEYSKQVEEGVTQAVTFVDRGSNGLDRGDKIITSQKMENRKNESRHWDVGDEILGKFGKKLKDIVDGVKADRGRVIAKMPQFSKGTCSVYQDDCKASGSFTTPLTLETKFEESIYSKNDLCEKGLTSFIPGRCEQVNIQFDYARADGQKTLKAEVRRLLDLDEELGYINKYGLDPQLDQYYGPNEPFSAALDVLYADVSGTRYLHVDLRKDETPAPQAQQAQL